MLEKIDGKRRRGWQGMRWLDSIAKSINMNFFRYQLPKDPHPPHLQQTGGRAGSS